MINEKFVQLHGPFVAGEELVDIIKRNCSNFLGIVQLGIQSIHNHVCCINGQDFLIGKTEILEFSEVSINSLYFKQNEPATTLIDCVLE